MAASTAVAASAAVAAESAMFSEAAMRKAVTPATMIPAIAPVVSVSVVNVTNGPVTNRLRHASGQGKTDADQQRDGPRQYSAVIHLRLRVL